MNLSFLEGLLAGLDTNDFSPSLEIESEPLLRRATPPRTNAAAAVAGLPRS